MYALRRRFAFFDFEPAFKIDSFRNYQSNLNNDDFNSLILQIEALNREITNDPSLGEGFQIGHSYFCNMDMEDISPDEMKKRLCDLVEYDLIPLLKEYWFDAPQKWNPWADKLRGGVR